MKRTATITTVLALVLLFASSAHASFGPRTFDATYTEKDGSPATQAASHPFAMTTTVLLNETPEETPDGELRDLRVQLPAGFAGDAAATPTCRTADFIVRNPVTETPECPDSTAVGTVVPWAVNPGPAHIQPVFNLAPPPGAIAKLGFWASNVVPITIEVRLSRKAPYRVEAKVSGVSQAVYVYGSELTLWGSPADPAHDGERGACVDIGGKCHVAIPNVPFLTLPTRCGEPLVTSYEMDSWQDPGALTPEGEPDLSDPSWVRGEALTHDNAEPPSPLGLAGCGKLAFSPATTAKPTSLAASSPTGLDFSLDVNDEGFDNPTGIAASDIRKSVVTMPEGFTTNPSLAEGLNACTEADLERETPFSDPGAGCPNASKIGTVEIETPALPEKLLHGSLYIAKPYENPFGSLLALYVVIKDPGLGINVVQPLRVENDPATGRITTVAEDMPQLPFSHFRLHFREGTRSPLATPPGCGSYDVKSEFTPWSGGPSVASTSTFQISSGPDGAPCPSGGLPPFHPGLIAGSINNAAGHYSPFNVRLFRTDSEQEITHFSIKLPPGVVGKLAGIPFCSDAAIQAATERTGAHGGQEELEHPSCPAASEIGRTLVGAGVGPSLAYAPGKVYLAGPYHGSPISVAAITAAKVGPFDLGTVVVREALRVNPETAEVFVDATGSDPIPHIIRGIPVHLRDIRVYVDRPDFVLNPTSCEPTSTASTVLGSGLDFVSEADDNPLTVSTRFQAADCGSLGFKPKLTLRLKGGTKRSQVPALIATLTARKGDANIAKSEVVLPHSEFLEQNHLGTSCTRVQYNQGGGHGAGCPSNSLIGRARAVTPILSEPLEGNVYLRSNGGERKIPDIVAALQGQEINIDLVGFIDSVREKTKKGETISRIRNRFEVVPDAPVEKFTLELFGGKKGLLVNSTNLCKGTHRAKVKFTGHNGKVEDFTPALKTSCPKGHKDKKHNKHPKRRG